jgi:hypothetical protein
MDILQIKKRYNEALEGLEANCKMAYGFDKPVLFEGGCYQGVWLECAPHESLVYGKHNPQVALSTHEIFFHHQREDGYLPFSIGPQGPGSITIQMVVPIASTSLEVAQLSNSESFLASAYNSCSRWDDWLVKNRNSRGTGLCELFCQYDSGHDGSPRHSGLPWQCPDNDPAKCPDEDRLPYLAPDLSACVYGGRIALAEMAENLGKPSEAQMWLEKAEEIRELIIKYCYDPEDECFYDVDPQGEFVRVKGDILTRLFSEHVVDQKLFDSIYNRHIKNSDAFWTPYPLPSIAANDDAFVKPIPQNCWGGASQALTALRTPRWFPHYGKDEDHKHLMKQWVEAIMRSPYFMQQVDPWTGEFTDCKTRDYSPCMLVFTDFVDRLELIK